jgi:hypothetical protein
MLLFYLHCATLKYGSREDLITGFEIKGLMISALIQYACLFISDSVKHAIKLTVNQSIV